MYFSVVLLFSLLIFTFFLHNREARWWEEYRPKRANTSAGAAGSRERGKHWRDHGQDEGGEQGNDDGTWEAPTTTMGPAALWGATTTVDESYRRQETSTSKGSLAQDTRDLYSLFSFALLLPRHLVEG
jgi:hypothetical protein